MGSGQSSPTNTTNTTDDKTNANTNTDATYDFEAEPLYYTPYYRANKWYTFKIRSYVIQNGKKTYLTQAQLPWKILNVMTMLVNNSRMQIQIESNTNEYTLVKVRSAAQGVFWRGYCNIRYTKSPGGATADLYRRVEIQLPTLSEPHVEYKPAEVLLTPY
jgi:hypothetical protein